MDCFQNTDDGPVIFSECLSSFKMGDPSDQ